MMPHHLPGGASRVLPKEGWDEEGEEEGEVEGEGEGPGRGESELPPQLCCLS